MSQVAMSDLVQVRSKSPYASGFTMLPNVLRDEYLPQLGPDGFTLAYVILSWVSADGSRSAKLGVRTLLAATGMTRTRLARAKKALLACLADVFHRTPGDQRTCTPETWVVDMAALAARHARHLAGARRAGSRGPGRPPGSSGPVPGIDTGFAEPVPGIAAGVGQPAPKPSTGVAEPVPGFAPGLAPVAPEPALGAAESVSIPGTGPARNLWRKSARVGGETCVDSRHTPVPGIDTLKDMDRQKEEETARARVAPAAPSTSGKARRTANSPRTVRSSGGCRERLTRLLGGERKFEAFVSEVPSSGVDRRGWLQLEDAEVSRVVADARRASEAGTLFRTALLMGLDRALGAVIGSARVVGAPKDAPLPGAYEVVGAQGRAAEPPMAPVEERPTGFELQARWVCRKDASRVVTIVEKSVRDVVLDTGETRSKYELAMEYRRVE